MAKWGEGDPRWIVEERPDAINVNNWHWTEKNATPWSKDRLRSLLADFVITEDINENNGTKSSIVCKVSSVNTVDGEATANNRKGKLIFFYEWNLVLKWSGSLEEGSESFTGDITIPNLSEENTLEEVQINIGLDKSSDESEKLRLFMYNVGREALRRQLGVYLKELREEFSKGLILPTKEVKLEQKNVLLQYMYMFVLYPTQNETKLVKPVVANIVIGNTKNKSTEQVIKSASGSAATVNPIDVKTLSCEELFQCRASDLYEVLTNQDLASAFTSGSSRVENHEGGT